MFLEFLYHFFSFDLDWLIRFIFDPHSLFWLFAMYAVASYFYAPKKALLAAFFLIIFNWLFVDFAILSGFGIPFGLLALMFLYNVFAHSWVIGDKDFDKISPQLAVTFIFGMWILLWFLSK
ncbi:MAG: hypothetical protein J4215_01030 [Candidatus Diapherotrites archaeon]|uniref:Uncharacterized protein n=1 Tax=Candidatus Iainarchaeum sp. TaxID=3101447 RepID=A0A8T4L3L0_9ARCH|nr:hypothetical protein [Candidatus Diapherotrites archaeon]